MGIGPGFGGAVFFAVGFFGGSGFSGFTTDAAAAGAGSGGVGGAIGGTATGSATTDGGTGSEKDG